MNFNDINKNYIEKEEINSCIKTDNPDWEKASFYFYKIASIVATRFKLHSSLREDCIQEAVSVAYIRRGSFDKNKNKCAYSYFYKVIMNHYKDVLRKKVRRDNIAAMVSYEVAFDDNVSDKTVHTIN